MIRQGTEDGLTAEIRKSALAAKEKNAIKQPDNERMDFGWESNRDDENQEELPWPDENESKE